MLKKYIVLSLCLAASMATVSYAMRNSGRRSTARTNLIPQYRARGYTLSQMRAADQRAEIVAIAKHLKRGNNTRVRALIEDSRKKDQFLRAWGEREIGRHEKEVRQEERARIETTKTYCFEARNAEQIRQRREAQVPVVRAEESPRSANFEQLEPYTGEIVDADDSEYEEIDDSWWGADEQSDFAQPLVKVCDGEEIYYF